MCHASSLAGSCPYSTWGFAESIWVQCIHHIKCEHNHPSLGVVGKLVRFCVAVGEGDVQGKYQMWLLNVTCLSINGIAVCALTLGSINALSDNDGALLTPLSSRIVLGLFFTTFAEGLPKCAHSATRDCQKTFRCAQCRYHCCQ